MKTLNVILSVILILIINNIVLLWLTGYFTEPSTIIGSSDLIPDNVIAEPQHRPSKIDPSDVNSHSVNAAVTESEELTPEIQQAIQDYVSSDQFYLTLEEWQSKASQRYQELSNRLTSMNTQELYAFVNESENPNEKLSALSYLVQGGKLSQLSSEELKNLYQHTGDQQWGKSKLLKVLLEKEDPDALTWAKALISDNNRTQNSYSSDIYDAIYHQDPEFIKRHIEETEFNPRSPQLDLFSFIAQEPDLATSFFNRNLDSILDSDNDNVFLYAYNVPVIEMSNQQEAKVLELFESRNRNKRNFAIGLAPQIEDTQALRQAYSTLERNQDKLGFVARLVSAVDNPDAVALGRELAASSDNPAIQRFANERNGY